MSVCVSVRRGTVRSIVGGRSGRWGRWQASIVRNEVWLIARLSREREGRSDNAPQDKPPRGSYRFPRLALGAHQYLLGWRTRVLYAAPPICQNSVRVHDPASNAPHRCLRASPLCSSAHLWRLCFGRRGEEEKTNRPQFSAQCIGPTIRNPPRSVNGKLSYCKKVFISLIA